MNKPKLYCQGNSVQRREAEGILQDFGEKIKWRSDGCDSVLDAGCGSGDVTVDILKPILPANFERLIGIDVSNEMIDYARKTQVHPKLSFEQFDLGVEIKKQSLNGMECVDHIFSFNCLHWVQNLRVCIENLYKLLVPGGDMLVTFVLSNELFDAYKEQSENSPWSKYMGDIDEKLPCMNITNSDQLLDILSKSGFSTYDVQVQDRRIPLSGIEGSRSKTNTICFDIQSFNISVNFFAFFLQI